MKTKIYFDGACPFCSREMEHYRRRPGSEAFEFINIANPEFSAEKEGLDPIRVNREMHVRDSNGQLHYGVDALIEIWRIMPGYERLSQWAKFPLINPLLRLGYRAFARFRPRCNLK